MRKKILFGSLLASFLMLVTPAATALEANAHEDAIEKTYETELEKFLEKVEKFDNKYVDIESISQLIQLNDKLFEDIDEGKLFSDILKKRSRANIFDDPGGPTDHNGPDDITDWMYLGMMGFSAVTVILLILFYFWQMDTPADAPFHTPWGMMAAEAFDTYDADFDGR